MAVVTDVFKIRSSFTVSNQNCILDPFRATRLWQHLVQHVQTSVNVSRHRHLFKSYDNVFEGSHLVDVVYNCLTHCVFDDIQKPIGRENAVKLCQVLVKNQLIESVVPKGDSKFEDSSSHLYQFNKELQLAEQPQEFNKENKKSREPMKTSPQVRSSFRVLKQSNVQSNTAHSFTLLKSKYKLPLQLKTISLTQTSDKNHTLLENVRDVALMHLLALIDVSFLEGVLSVPDNLPKLEPLKPQLIIENCGTNCTWDIGLYTKYGNMSNIPWVSAAAACLGHYPRGVEHLWSLQACKMLCYQTVLEYYCQLQEPLIPEAFLELATAIIELFKTQQRDKANLATRLFVLLLPSPRQQQVRFLLEFLHLAITDIFISVDKKITNYEAVSRDFLDIFMKHSCVSRETFQILFDFMAYKVHSLFQVPKFLINKQRLMFCEKISLESARVISKELTDHSLKQLSFSVMDSTSLKLTEKKLWLKKLKKVHPEIHKHCAVLNSGNFS